MDATQSTSAPYHRGASLVSNVAGPALANGAWVLGTSSAPLRLQSRIAPSQAKYSTYASRMRAGTTTLMQPIQRSANELDGTSVLGTRSARQSVYYGEDESDDDDEGSEYEDEEFSSSQRRKRRRGAHESRSASSPDTRVVDPEAEAELAAPGSQLGLPVSCDRLVVRPAKRTPHTFPTEQQLQQQSEFAEVLVPIRIEFHTNTHRIKDVFLWNLHERLITPYQFAHIFLQDLELPMQPYAVQIESLIIQQLSDAMSVLDREGDGISRILDLKSSARERKRIETEVEMQRRRAAAVLQAASASDSASPSAPRKRGRPRKHPAPESKEDSPVVPPQPQSQLLSQPPAPTQPLSQASVPVSAPTAHALPAIDNDSASKSVDKASIHDAISRIDAEDDLRVIVEYEVQISRHMLRDRLEWDLCSTLTPEAFAKTLTRDLGLPLESGVLISHAVREQLLHHRRAAMELGLFGSGKIYKCIMDELLRIDKAERALLRASASPSESGQGATGAAPSECTAATSAMMDLDPLSEDEALHQRRAISSAAMTNASDMDEWHGATLTRDDQAPPHTRSRRLAAAAQYGSLSHSHDATAAFSAPSNLSSSAPFPPFPSAASIPFLVPDESLPLALRRHQALMTLRDLLAVGPRPLEGAWRDFAETSDFGPLLEYLSEAEMEKMEEADLRASRYVLSKYFGLRGLTTNTNFCRRNRRDAQRAGRSRR